MKAIWINASRQTIEPVEQNGLQDLQRLVGGYIEVAHRFPNGDVVFVDEEGLLKQPSLWFAIRGGHQPFAGNGVIVGSEDGEGEVTEPKSTLDELQRVIRFAVSFQ